MAGYMDYSVLPESKNTYLNTNDWPTTPDGWEAPPMQALSMGTAPNESDWYQPWENQESYDNRGEAWSTPPKATATENGIFGALSSIGGKLSEGFSTFTGLISGLMGNIAGSVSSPVDPKNPTQPGSDAMGKIYATAIAAGITGIAGYLNNQDNIKGANALADRKFAQDKELLSVKYQREDDERKRRGAVASGAQGRIQYKPDSMAGYTVPGQTNQQRYGLLGGAR